MPLLSRSRPGPLRSLALHLLEFFFDRRRFEPVCVGVILRVSLPCLRGSVNQAGFIRAVTSAFESAAAAVSLCAGLLDPSSLRSDLSRV